MFVASHSHVIVEAAGKNAGPLNINGLQAFLISVVGLLIIVVGAGIVMSSRKGDMAKTANTSVIAIIGLVFVAMGAGTVAVVALGLVRAAPVPQLSRCLASSPTTHLAGSAECG